MPRFSIKGSTISGLGQVRSGSITYGETTMVDVTAISDEREIKLPGTMEPVSFEAVVLWDPQLAGHAAAMSAYLAKTLTSATVQFSNTQSVVQPGYYTNISAPIEVDGEMVATFSFKGTGVPAFNNI